MEQEITKDIVVLYHAECMDGFSAAWAARKKFEYLADYIPVKHGLPTPAGLENKEIYLVDFTYPKEITLELIKNNKSVIGIDHHMGMEEVIKLIPNHVFDNNHSGAVLAWKYFHPNRPVPKFLEYVEDGDLWKFSLVDTISITTYADLYLGNFDKWNQVVLDIENEDTRLACIEKAKTLLAYQDIIVESLLRQKQKVEFVGHEVYTVNGPRIFRSRIGNVLAKTQPPFGIYWYQEKDYIHVSLRSLKDEPFFDVDAVAKKFGGGGHKSASSFGFPADQPFPWKIIKENK